MCWGSGDRVRGSVAGSSYWPVHMQSLQLAQRKVLDAESGFLVGVMGMISTLHAATDVDVAYCMARVVAGRVPTVAAIQMQQRSHANMDVAHQP